jgi:hypothetical protein
MYDSKFDAYEEDVETEETADYSTKSINNFAKITETQAL